MLKGQDVVALLRLVDVDDRITVRELAEAIGLDIAGTHRALTRLEKAGLYDSRRHRAPVAAAEEFLIHALKYLFPPKRGGETRGVPTAWAAPPLSSDLAETAELPPVWPHPLGTTRGIAFEPLHPSVPELALRDVRMARRLALADAVRSGDARVRRLAEDKITTELGLRA